MMSLLSFIKQILKKDMPMQRFIEDHDPKSVYEVEQLQRKYEFVVKTNHTYI
jgi:hypothetical protein